MTRDTTQRGAAFVRPAKLAQFEANENAVQEAGWREYVQKVIGDAMKATAGA